MQTFHRVKCYQQQGSSDCGLYSIAYAVDLLENIDPATIIYDQSRMREHLIGCFKKGKITSLPKYKVSFIQENKNHINTESDWKKTTKRISQIAK